MANVGKRLSIEEKILAHYKNFLEFCRKAGKHFANELKDEDFIHYGAEYLVSREEIDRLKILFGFRLEEPAKKILAAQFTSGEPRMSLRKFYFHLDDITPYEGLNISEINLNKHINNVLVNNGYKTLGQLLKTSRKKLLALKNFGDISFNKLIAALKNFFDSRQKEIPAEILELNDGEINEFLRYELSKPDPQINLVIAVLERFPQPARAKKFFDCLPDKFKEKPARPFLFACGLDIPLPAKVTLARLPARHDFNDDELKKFVREFLFDVRSYVKNFILNLTVNARAFKILTLRAKGTRLNRIARDVGLTGERCRQIILTSIKHFKKREAEVLKIFFFLRALNDDKILLPLDDIKKFLDANDVDILFFLTANANFQSDFFHFDAEIKTLMFHGETTLDYDELLKNFPDNMEENFFNEKVRSLAREKNCPVDLIQEKILKFYTRSGIFLHRDRLTLTFKVGYVLKEKFPDGYKVNDENSYRKMLQYIKEIFAEETTSSPHAIIALICRVGVLCARGKYIHSDYVHVPQEIIDRIKNFIEASDRTAIFYKEIFLALKDFFVGTQITNRYSLQGVIKLSNLPYTLRKDYLTKSDETDMAKEFDSFVAECGKVSVQKIRKNFISLSNSNITILLKRCPKIFRVAENEFMHASRLNLLDEDFEPIKNFLRKNCLTPVNSRLLLVMFRKNFADFMARNKIQNSGKLFGVLRYMFHDDFNFSRPYISTKSDERITNKKILLNALEGKDKVKIKKLFALRAENAMGHASRTYLFENMSPEFIPVDEFNLARPESVGVTDEIVSAVVQIIREAVERNGGWLAAKIFKEYKRLPKLPVPWNSFLLEGVMTLAKNPLPKLRIPLASANISGVIFLAEKFADENFQSFVRKILLARHEKKPFRSNDEILVWLKAQGFYNKNLPKFLREGNLFGF